MCQSLVTSSNVQVINQQKQVGIRFPRLNTTQHHQPCAGQVHAVATEDMDALCCGATVLVRRLTMSEARKMPIQEFKLDKVLEGLDLSMDRFVDLCLLCGSDFCETIKGVGPKTALNLIRKNGDLAGVINSLNGTKHSLPEFFPYQEARKLLRYPQVFAAQ